MHVGGIVEGVGDNLDLRVVDAGEVAGAGGLVLLGLEREGVGVDTGHGAARVVVEGLHLVEVLALLLLETVLAVEDELEGVEGTDGLLGEDLVTTVGTDLKEGSTRRSRRHEGVGSRDVGRVRLKHNVGGSGSGGEVPEGVLGGGVGEAPHKLLHGVVVGEANLLGTSGGDGVGTGVLHLLDEVLMTLLGEAATLLGVEVHVVGPHLEDLGVKEGVEVGREVEIDANLVVLEGNEGKIETGIAVEKEDEREVDSLAVTRSGHLTPVELLGLVEVELGVEAPPLLVVLVDTLTTDGKLDVVDGALGDVVAVTVVISRGSRNVRLKLDVHVADEITVAGNSHGDATGVGGSTVDGLLDVLHREVGVALVLRLVEGNLGVTGKVDVLSAVSYELHKTTGHFESCCTIYRENNFGRMRISRPQFFSDQNIMTTYPDEIPENPIEDGEIVTDDEEVLSLSDEEEEPIEEFEDEGSVDIADLMTSLMATENGDTVCSALVSIANQLQIQNKILIKMLSKINSA